MRIPALISSLIMLLSFQQLSGYTSHRNEEPVFLKYMYHEWVDSVFNTLTIDEQIAQSIWVATWSNRSVRHAVEIRDLIVNHKIGGLLFFQGTPERQAEMINYYQSVSEVPLLISMDAEWGLGMRLDGVESFPFQMTLGAIADDSLIYQMGHMVAAQAERMGVHVNLAPVADINNNPDNPVINFRSFGEDRANVASKAVMYMKGMQDNGLLATAKHFPGHGDTDVDSHFDLPVILHNRERFDSIELHPFSRMIESGLGAIMTAHINIPELDPRPNLPGTLSRIITTDLLRKEMGFRGITITDAMNMQGVTKYYPTGIAEAMAFEAGHDILEFVTDVKKAIEEIRSLVESGRISTGELELRCRRVLALKYWAGLAEVVPVKTENIREELSPPEMTAFIRTLYENALTVLENRGNTIPVGRLERLKIASLAINSSSTIPFQKSLERYVTMSHYTIDINGGEEYNEVLQDLEMYDLVIAGFTGTDQRPGRGFGIRSEHNSLLGKLGKENRLIVVYFGNPYAIAHLNTDNADALVVTYQNNDHTQDLAAQLLFGAVAGRGQLPVTVNSKYPLGHGIKTAGDIRLRYGLPETAGMSSAILNRRIDSLALLGIEEGAYPGCVIIAARRGVVVFSRSYGHHRYGGRIEVREDDLYDMASLTKILSVTPALMMLQGDGVFSPDRRLEEYLSFFKGSDKGNLVIRDMLAHQSGLRSWIPFWKDTVRESGDFRYRTFQFGPSARFPHTVANNLYIHRTYRERLFREIKRSELMSKEYRYSDLAFIVLPDVINMITADHWTNFLNNRLYSRLGAKEITYNPFPVYPLARIVPTENDTLFRRQLLHGYVHDEGASMLGGVSGHAGLFGTAGDVLKVMEMFRRGGSYGGIDFIDPEIVKEYTSYQFPDNDNRRGLGFDKPLLDNDSLPDDEVYPIREASPSSFGHFGFTGTFTWVDPEKEISYVFLSNRVYPTRNNSTISDLNIRTEILKALYESITD